MSLWPKPPAPSKGCFLVAQTPSTTFFLEYDALGALTSGNRFFCSGTLVSQTFVVTAAHCLIDYASWDGLPESHPSETSGAGIFFAIGPSVENAEALIPVSRIYFNPLMQNIYGDRSESASSVGTYNDIALIELAYAASDDVPTIIPIPPLLNNLEDLTDAPVMVGGYGLTQNNSVGEKHYGAFSMKRLSPPFYELNSTNQSLGSGDSGSGALVKLADGRYHVAGVATGPIFSGTFYDGEFGTMLGAHREWIQGHVGDLCGNETQVGRCLDGVAVYCENGQVRSDDCGAREASCGQTSCSQNRCTQTSSSENACEGLDFYGSCENNMLRYCNAGEIVAVNCEDLGLVCGQASTSNADMNCVLDPIETLEPDVFELEDIALESCTALQGCVRNCEREMSCQLDCYAQSSSDALSGVSALATCQICAIFGANVGVPCNDLESISACSDECANDRFSELCLECLATACDEDVFCN